MDADGVRMGEIAGAAVRTIGAVWSARGRASLVLRGAAPALALLLLIDVLATRPASLWHLGSLSLLVVAATLVGAVGEIRTSGSLRALTGTVEALAAGDATARFHGRPALVHMRLAESTNVLGHRLHDTISEFRRATETLESGWREVSDVSFSMSDNAETTAARAADAANAAELVSEAVQMVAGASQELVASFQDVSAHASQAAQVAALAAERVTDTTATAVELAAATGRAEDVLGLIVTVARQTHLLALNARVEAARAGANGAGFTVIADEVKHLANVTADATGEVGATVASIQVGSADVTGGMQELDETIASVSASQTAIAAAVEQQTVTARSIGQSVTEAADEVVVIADVLAQFAREAGLTAYAGTRARATAGTLASASATLRAVVDQFIVDDEDQPARPDQANARSDRVARVEGRTTVIANDVHGDGLNEFAFSGLWSHDSGSVVTDANSYSSVVGDSVSLRFHGTSVRLFSVKDAHHGMLGLTVDDEPERLVDTYSPERLVGAQVFATDGLSAGEHCLRVRITGERNPASRFHWGAVTHAEVE